jgi:hypothetical protein
VKWINIEIEFIVQNDMKIPRHIYIYPHATLFSKISRCYEVYSFREFLSGSFNNTPDSVKEYTSTWRKTSPSVTFQYKIHRLNYSNRTDGSEIIHRKLTAWDLAKQR